MLAAIPAPARTQAPLSDIRELAPNVYVAGIPTNEFKFVAARQHAGNWCWAAAIQMVLIYDGLAVSQDQIVARVFGGSMPDTPAEPEDILDALSGWAPQFNGRPAEILATPYVYQPNDIVGDLANHWPILVGLRNPEGRGHVFVLTAVTYSLDSTNQPVFRTAVLRIPRLRIKAGSKFPGTSSHRAWISSRASASTGCNQKKTRECGFASAMLGANSSKGGDEGRDLLRIRIRRGSRPINRLVDLFEDFAARAFDHQTLLPLATKEDSAVRCLEGKKAGPVSGVRARLVFHIKQVAVSREEMRGIVGVAENQPVNQHRLLRFLILKDGVAVSRPRR